MTVDHNEDIDKEIHISLSIFWDIAIQGGNEVMRYLSNSFIYVKTIHVAHDKCAILLMIVSDF